LPEDVEGLKALGKLLDELPARIQRNVLHGAVRATAKELVPALQAAAPVWSGRLEESITVRRESAAAARTEARKTNKLWVAAGIALKGVAKRYWHFSEFGTVKRPARPWIRPTFAKMAPRLEQFIREYVGKRIEREARKLAKEKAGG
jgi:HK97 gp10 family phage protein